MLTFNKRINIVSASESMLYFLCLVFVKVSLLFEVQNVFGKGKSNTKTGMG